jgi:hypothetical protein
MKIPEIKRLVGEHGAEELDAAANAFEETGQSPIEVNGDDDGDKLTNLLIAAQVRARVDGGESLQQALRDVSKSVRELTGG